VRPVSTLINHTIPAGRSHNEPDKELEFTAAGAGIRSGFLRVALLQCRCISAACFQYDFITVFHHRRSPPRTSGTEGSINIIAYSSRGYGGCSTPRICDGFAEAKAESLLAMDLPLTGTPADGIIVGYEGSIQHSTAGRLTEPGRRYS